ncbi:hypothetical protein H4582DRAFT_1426636 [Lactarius indigo]|nr:hypothetical protein H4582DRAFT_1426636 [Lactarius indigo]
MSTDYLLPAYWNPDTCVATSAMNQPRLFTHWIPRLQTLNERSLSQLRQQPTHSRLKFIDEYLEGARRGEDTFVSLGMPESSTTTHKLNRSVLGENTTTCVASPSSTAPSSPGHHLPRPITTTLIPTFSQSSDLGSPTTSSPVTPNLLPEAMVEDPCPPEYLSQRTCTYPDVPSPGGVLPISIVET